jgi:hypothetical protein
MSGYWPEALKGIKAAKRSKRPMKHINERMEGIRCRNYRCQYNDHGFEQACSAAYLNNYADCVVRTCLEYEPEHTLPVEKDPKP